MKKINLDKLKKCQLEILDVVDEFCKKNNINYWLDSGTLIGAVRHNGYIPWDDDIDIGMLRKDFEVFEQKFNEFYSNYKVYSIDNNRNFWFPYAKILKMDSIFYEPNKEEGIEYKINIDLFIYDDVVMDNKIISKMMRKRDFLKKIRVDIIFNKTLINKYKSEKFSIKKYYKLLFLNLIKIIPLNMVLLSMSKNAKKYADYDCDIAGNFLGYSNFVFEKKWVTKTINHKFEKKNYPIPIDYDKFLKAIYGDYMKLPPVEERTFHHEFEAYIIDKK